MFVRNTTQNDVKVQHFYCIIDNTKSYSQKLLTTRYTLKTLP